MRMITFPCIAIVVIDNGESCHERHLLNVNLIAGWKRPELYHANSNDIVNIAHVRVKHALLSRV